MRVLGGVRGGVYAAAMATGFLAGGLVRGRLAAQTDQGAGGHTVSQQATPEAKQPTIAEKIAASKALLDINTATAAQLKALPGMGDEYARRVIAGRPYTAKNQLATRGVLPQAEYEQIREFIVAHRVKQ